MESMGGGVPRSSNWPLRSGDTKGEGRRSSKLAYTKEHKRGIEIPRISQLLQVLHQRLCQDCYSITPTGQKGRKVGMGGKTSRNISKVERSFYNRTCPSHPGLR